VTDVDRRFPDSADRGPGTTLVDCPRDSKTGEAIPGLSFSEIGKASRFGDETLIRGTRCNVFEVVLQRKEASMCPACARNPERAKLPARECQVPLKLWRC
jgi:hypothetical protein